MVHPHLVGFIRRNLHADHQNFTLMVTKPISLKKQYIPDKITHLHHFSATALSVGIYMAGMCLLPLLAPAVYSNRKMVTVGCPRPLPRRRRTDHPCSRGSSSPGASNTRMREPLGSSHSAERAKSWVKQPGMRPYGGSAKTKSALSGASEAARASRRSKRTGVERAMSSERATRSIFFFRIPATRA